VESSILYFNAEYVRQVVWERVQATPSVRLVIGDLSDSPMVDVAGARMLVMLYQELAKRESQLRIVGAHAKVRDLLRAEALEDRVGYLGRHISVDQAIQEFQETASLSSAGQ